MTDPDARGSLSRPLDQYVQSTAAMHPYASGQQGQAGGPGAESRHNTYAEWFAWAKRHVDDVRLAALVGSYD